MALNTDEVTVILDRLHTAFPNTPPIEPGTIGAWVNHMRDVMPDEAMEATEWLIEHDKFFPRIADFKAAVHTVGRERANARLLAQQAVTSGCEKCRGVGWVEGKPLELQIGSTEITYSSTRPCECSELYAWWVDWREEQRVRRIRRSDPTLRLHEFNPQEGLGRAYTALYAAVSKGDAR